MLGIVKIALRRPYTFVVLALLILIFGVLAILRTPTDIFPNIRIPVISVVWQYTGLPPDGMAGRITTNFQRTLTTTVNDIEHIEANSYTGFGVIKIFFQPNADINTANAQVTAIAQTILRQMPPGVNPPMILNYNASTVSILQLALSGEGMTEQQLADLGLNTIRTQLVTVPGAAIPFPFGGKNRQIQIDLDPTALQARGLSGTDVANALAAQNLITPVGTQKIGGFEYVINLNNSPSAIEDLGRLPIRLVDGAMVYLRDVAHVRDGNAPQTNIVHVDGGRSVLINVLKNGSASTLAVIEGIKNKAEQLKAQLPDAMQIKPIGDQSIFVRSAITGVVVEGAIAAVLTSLMILLFLGSWRSTVIIATSIPLAVLGSVFLLSMTGQTLNIMTLGGLALAVGILVDDATVTIENINWHLEHGKDVKTSILDGAAQIVTPAFVSLLCICNVFVPMFFLEGVARFLFVPMALAVIFAMVCSFILSRTLVPTMAMYLLRPHSHEDATASSTNPLVKFQRSFSARFERFRGSYKELLSLAMSHRRVFVTGFMLFVLASFLLVPFLGRNFFPSVDSGQIMIHFRAQPGTRVEETANLSARIQDVIRQIIPPDELMLLVDNVGMPFSSINMTYNNTGTIGPQDGDIQVTLEEEHQPTAEYVRRLREELPKRFPGASFSFTPADIVSQILNFGSPAPIDVQIRGNNLAANYAYAERLLADIKRIPGVADARIQQARGLPTFNVDVDRTRAQFSGLTERDVTNSMVVNLAGSVQVAPTFWLNPETGIQYPIVMQTPQYRMDELSSLATLPVTGENSRTSHLLGGIADITRTTSSGVISQYNIQRMVQIYATTQGADLGSVASRIREIIDAHAEELPKGSSVELLGQARTMDSSFSGLIFGLIGAIVLIYLLVVVNFQSWSDPLVIISALPAALAGIVWMLFTTFTSLSVPALTGAIMCMGVATANSVLVVSFARERLEQLADPIAAAIDAGFVRFRPVLMTALAMIIGMAPMALGLGEGGEQNAPLGRAVIGGLIFATVATLMFVPVVFSIVHRHYARKPDTDPSFAGEPHAAH
ncbi:efflux RND transporter permease subunit [Steroidobacter sp. S1-65]|uniref:Efflux RND transporter permease subunit n=1 Tax=Steroidobacter gossypii TaxID=2805490 RepID=A0ABS1WU03_9GAMM|nr:efflux RND transporter permease subunit [Steroidobacter gossypii]MBM0104455.1 efflux RND transporter permease subunit [Steroidobacter gossypii]